MRRDTGAKKPVSLDNIEETISDLLSTIQSDMFNTAKTNYWSRVKPITEWNDVVPALDGKNIIAIPWCETEACEDDIKDRSGRA